MYRSKLANIFTLLTTLFILSACSPSPQFNYSDGNTGHLNDFKGRITLVNYWAEWCKPCLKEIPELSEMNHKYADVVVIAINWDGIKGEELNQAATKLGIDFPMILEDISPLLGKKKPEVLPTTYIFNQEGNLVNTLVGPQTLASLEQSIGK